MLKFFRVPLAVVAGLLLVLVTYGYASQAMNSPTYTIKVFADGITDKEIAHSREYLEEFLDSCSWIEGKNSDKIIGTPTVELHKPIPYRQEQHGWPWELRFSFKVRNDAGSASGHRLEYFIWKDRWETIKNAGADFCGKNSEPGKNTVVYF